MSEFFGDSFDKYANLTEAEINWTGLAGGNFSFNASGGRFGGGAINGISANAIMRPNKNINFARDNTTTWQAGFSFKSGSASANSSGNDFVVLGMDGGNFHVVGGPSLNYNTLSISSNAGLGISGINVQDGAWHWFELQFLMNLGLTSTFTAYVDGILDKAATSQNFSSSILNWIGFNPGALQSGSGNNGWIDDVLIWNGDGSGLTSFPIGPQRAFQKLPASDASVQYTPSTGSVNANCVNLGYSGGQNVHDSTTGHVDLYNFAASPAALATISTVIMNHYGQNSGGSGTSNCIAKISNGSVASGPTNVLPVGSNLNLQSFFHKDPSNALWSAATVDSATAGQGD